jgi:hypothetical protein
VGHLRRAPSGNWRAAYRTPEGKERTKTFKTKREARAFLAQVEGDKTRGLYVDPAAPSYGSASWRSAGGRRGRSS